MVINQGLKFIGSITCIILDKNGKVRDFEIIPNTVMNVGKAAAAKLLGGLSTSYFRYVALGTDPTAAAATQTALLAEITTGGGSRAAVSASSVTTTSTDDTLRLVANWTFSSGFTIRETGIFDLNALGVMFARQVINKIVSVGESLQITWNIQAS